MTHFEKLSFCSGGNFATLHANIFIGNFKFLKQQSLK